LFTYIPDNFYSEINKEDFIHLVFSEKEEKFLDHSVPIAKTTVLYPISNEVYNFFLHAFNEPDFIHYSAPLITYFYPTNITNKERQMIINFHKKGVDIFCFSNKMFLFGNHFPCDKHQDAMYYVLYTWKQLKMNQFVDSIHVTGEYEENEEFIENLQLYIQHVYPDPIPAKYQFEIIDPNELPFEMAVFSLCES
jgi:hypothetical protein